MEAVHEVEGPEGRKLVAKIAIQVSTVTIEPLYTIDVLSGRRVYYIRGHIVGW